MQLDATKVTPQITQANLLIWRSVGFDYTYELSYTFATCPGYPSLVRRGWKRVGGEAERDGELIHLKSFSTPPHHPHCDPNTILVTAVIESLKSTQLAHPLISFLFFSFLPLLPVFLYLPLSLSGSHI